MAHYALVDFFGPEPEEEQYDFTSMYPNIMTPNRRLGKAVGMKMYNEAMRIPSSYLDILHDSAIHDSYTMALNYGAKDFVDAKKTLGIIFLQAGIQANAIKSLFSHMKFTLSKKSENPYFGHLRNKVEQELIMSNIRPEIIPDYWVYHVAHKNMKQMSFRSEYSIPVTGDTDSEFIVTQEPQIIKRRGNKSERRKVNRELKHMSRGHKNRMRLFPNK